MSFNNIAAPIEKTHLLRGAYRINFIAPTEAGNFVVFIPRRSFIFWEHKECKKFLKLINTQQEKAASPTQRTCGLDSLTLAAALSVMCTKYETTH